MADNKNGMWAEARPDGTSAATGSMNSRNKTRKGKLRILRPLLVAFASLVALAGLSFALLPGKELVAPAWLRGKVEARVNDLLASSSVEFGTLALVIDREAFVPSVILRQVRLKDQEDHDRAILPELNMVLDGASFVRGNLRPVRIRVPGAALVLKRDAEGRFDISVGDDSSPTLEQDRSVAELLSAIEGVVDEPLFSHLQSVKITNVALLLDDQMSGRSWRFHDGAVTLLTSDEEVSATAAFQLENKDREPAEASFTLRKTRGEGGADFSTHFSGVRARDVAEQVVALNWLRILRAPIAGSVSLNILPDGGFGGFHGVLDIGAGELTQGPEAKPVLFSGAKTYLTFDPKSEKLTFNQVSVKTDAAQVAAEGVVYLGDRSERTLGAIVGQFRFTKIKLAPKAVFAAPVSFELGVIDLRVRFDPLAVDIGQFVLMNGGSTFVARGGLELLQEGWRANLDFTVDRMEASRILALWPVAYKARTRDWMADNITSGSVYDAAGGLRMEPGQKPEMTVGFNVEDLTLRFIKTLPPFEGGKGYGVLSDRRFDATLETGLVRAPDGGLINIAGSTFAIPDVTIQEAPAEIGLKTQSSIPAMLSILDLKPFEFISKGGFKTDIAEGTATTDATIGLPLAQFIPFDAISFVVSGQMSGVSSDSLVTGKVVTADRLNLYADDAGLAISGDARVGKLPVSGRWEQKFGVEHKGRSQLEVRSELSVRFLDEFSIVLPKDSVRGAARSDVTIDLVRGKPPAFRLVSDLNRAELALSALGWRKPANATGKLEVRGAFSSPPRIDRIEISAKGLEAVGAVKLTKDGHLEVARFSQLTVDGWFKSPVEIRPGDDGKPSFTLDGGSIDFRRSRFGDTGGDGNKVVVRLDRLILSSGIALTNVEGDLTTAGGVSGSFAGQVNGGARIVGTLAPQNKGTAVRFTSSDAGAVLRSAGVFESAIGGRMDMLLVPSDKRGEYDGVMKIGQTRVRNANALAALLSAISVVGLLEQLGGEGIAFNTVDAKFRLTPTNLIVRESSAVGASLGLTMQGVYSLNNSSMDMQGVITPIYMLNGLLEQTKIFGGLFGKQKGEGLLGFNYTLKGPTDAPRVGVNPLSLLTPGLFREIFRQPMPEPSE